VQTLAVPVVSSREPNIEELSQFQYYIHFTSIDPAQNRYRFYTLTWQPGLWEEVSLVRSWGRIGRRGRCCVRIYASRADAQADIFRLIRHRLRRGYERVGGK
jgi:predicted DNA-binding WGR domain protein